MRVLAMVVIGLCAWILSATPVVAQTSFKVGEADVQVHGSIQQGSICTGLVF